MGSKMRELSRQEHFHLDTLANLNQFMDRFSEDRDKNQLEGWKQRIETVYREFQSNRLKIELLIDQANEASSDGAVGSATNEEIENNNRIVRQKFENDFIVAYGFLTTKIRELNSQFPNISQS